MSDATDLLQKENQQLKNLLAAKEAEIQTFMMIVGGEHAQTAKQALDGMVHLLRAARQNEAVKADIERLVTEVEGLPQIA